MRSPSLLRFLPLVLCTAALLSACAELPTPVAEGALEPGPLRLIRTPTSGLVTMDVGWTHSCGLTSAGMAWCWGRNSNAQLGDSSFAVRTVPVAVRHPRGAPSCEIIDDTFICTVGNPLPFTSVTAGAYHSCALTSTGQAYCWGYNADGRLGDSTTTTPRKPVAVKPLGGFSFTQISAGDRHTCALNSSGAAYCWGYNLWGQIGDSATTFRQGPRAVQMPSGVTFSQIHASENFTCALGTGGQAYCWGYGGDGQTGDNSIFGLPIPSAVLQPSGVTFTSITTGNAHACGLTSGGQTYCWGNNDAGQLGDGTTTDQPTPVAVAQPSGVTFTAIRATLNNTCGLTSGGAAYCWGANGVGELGDGNAPTASLSPVAVTLPSGGVTFTQLHGESQNACGLDGSNGQVYCWGRNNFYQLGNGTTTDASTPTPVLH
jgi:alpha-tubulin suppressor-like RCC1 family protein